MKEVYELITRVLPGYQDQIICEIKDDFEGKDGYEIDWKETI